MRELMAARSSWAGSAADLLRASADRGRDGIGRVRTGRPQNPRALAGRLRRAQSSLRALGIEIAIRWRMRRDGTVKSNRMQLAGVKIRSIETGGS